MKILGISNAENSGACIIADGRVVAAASEERFSRIKMDESWPAQSIDFVLKQCGLDLNSFDAVAYGWARGFDPSQHLVPYLERIQIEKESNPEGVPVFYERILSEIERDKPRRAEFEKFVKDHALESRAIYIDHHDCHAYGAFVPSPFEKALVVTADGRGDFQAVSVSVFDREKSRFLYRSTSVDSLGFFYGRITALLGYKVRRHEAKITGLAAHGDPEKHLPLMQSMVRFEDGRVLGVSGWQYLPFYTNFSERLQEVVRQAKPEDIAAAAQRHLENLSVQLVSHYLKQSEETEVCLAGGVFANVRVNQKILEIPGVRNIYVQPHMTDGGLAEGAALGAAFSLGQTRILLPNVYLGPEYAEGDIAPLVTAADLEVQHVDDVVPAALQALRENKVIGWFQGRMEWGPRALCHRSIIYHCRDQSANDWLNKRMHRTEFMPFAPVTPEEIASRAYLGWNPEQIAAQYMTLTYHCTDEMKLKCPAAVHIDGTARPQIVTKDSNPLAHRLLTEWCREENDLGLINTSFNIHEEPIVCRPEDGLAGLRCGMIDILIIENYCVTLKQRNQPA